MNNLAQSLVNHNGHLTWRQRLRLLTVQIFGHEGLYSVNHLIKTSHCPVLDEDIHRLYTLKWEHLAKRKLLNPFKWVEFAISVPLEMMTWASWWLYLIPKAFTEVTLGVARRVLAPVRYVIRPTIEMAREKPFMFIAVVAATLAIAAYLASVIFSGGGTLVVGGIILASLAAKGGFFAAAAAGIYMGLLKLTSTIDNIIDLLRRPKPPRGEDQKVKQFTNGAVIKEVKVDIQVIYSFYARTVIEPVPVKVENSQYTHEITESLHAINPKHTDVKKPSEQSLKHQLALFTGTESFFFKPSNKPKPPCDFEYIDNNDLYDYKSHYIPTK